MKVSHLLEQYVSKIRERFPAAEVSELEDPPVGADYYVRVNVPPDSVEDAREFVASLAVDLYLERGVYILNSVSGTGPVGART